MQPYQAITARTIGTWEYLSKASSLLINRTQGNDNNQDIILLNQDFIDPGVMILKKDGLKNDLFIMANENLIPDLDVQKYLNNFYLKKNNITTIELTDGRILEIFNKDYIHFRSNQVAIDCKSVPDGKFYGKSENINFIIEESKIVKALTIIPVKTNKGEITIEIQHFQSFSKGDLVYKDGRVAPDGKYRLGLFNTIKVKDGKIVYINLLQLFINQFY